jgi:hypothetical protein
VPIVVALLHENDGACERAKQSWAEELRKGDLDPEQK